jgi:putative ABC transport system ATP-binding protein
MMMVIAGLERPTGGSVHVAGQNLATLNEDALARFRRKQVGIVFQAFHLIPTMTALENVAVPLEFSGDKKAFDRARESLELVGLSHRLDHYPSQLSGGEQQRVALARAFAPHPNLLLADEPTGNLDRETGERIIETLFELSEQHGTTMLLITHDLAIAGRCDRTVYLRDGQIVDSDQAR